MWTKNKIIGYFNRDYLIVRILASAIFTIKYFACMPFGFCFYTSKYFITDFIIPAFFKYYYFKNKYFFHGVGNIVGKIKRTPANTRPKSSCSNLTGTSEKQRYNYFYSKVKFFNIYFQPELKSVMVYEL